MSVDKAYARLLKAGAAMAGVIGYIIRATPAEFGQEGLLDDSRLNGNG